MTNEQRFGKYSMMVFLGKRGEPLTDVTNKLLASEKLKLTLERETEVFLKTVPDARLAFSNLDDTFTNLFMNTTAKQRWELMVTHDGRTLFFGELQNSQTEFSVQERTVQITAFDISKIFFEQAKETNIPKKGFTNDTRGLINQIYLTIPDFLDFIFLNCPNLRSLFASMQIAAEYRTKQIRFWELAYARTETYFLGKAKQTGAIASGGAFIIQGKDTYWTKDMIDGIIRFSNRQERTILDVPNSTTLIVKEPGTIDESIYTISYFKPGTQYKTSQYTNEGMYRFLDDELTVYDLLEAFAQYYNAEFFIDPETRNLTMNKRETMGYVHAEPIIMREDVPITIALADTERYDYIAVASNVPKPAKPFFSVVEMGISYTGATTSRYFPGWRYLVVFEIANAHFVIESQPGEESEIVSVIQHIKPLVSLFLPTGPAGTTARKIYRQGIQQGGAPYRNYELISRVANNTEVIFQDTISYQPRDQQDLRQSEPTGKVWISFDEEANRWNAPLYDDKYSDSPDGRILDLVPNLKFTSVLDGTTSLPFNTNSVQAFFGNEITSDFSILHGRWIDFFKTKRLLKCGSKNINVRDGDQVSLLRTIDDSLLLRMNSFRIKKVTIDLFNERTDELELVTL